MAEILGVEVSGQGSQEYSFSEKAINRRHKLTIWMRALDSANEREESIRAQCGVAIGDIWASGGDIDALSRCYKLDANERFGNGTYTYWTVDADYSSKTPEDSEEDKPPEERKPEWEWDAEIEEHVIAKDPITGDVIANSVGEPLIVTAPVPIPILTISRYLLSFDPQNILDYVGRTNTANFWGAPPKAAYMASITDRKADVQGANGADLRRVTYKIKFGMALPPETWELELLDHGSKHFKVGAVSEIEDFTTTDGNLTTGNLNGLGFELPAGQDPVYLTYNRFRDVDFSALKLGPTVWF